MEVREGREMEGEGDGRGGRWEVREMGGEGDKGTTCTASYYSLETTLSHTIECTVVIQY